METQDQVQARLQDILDRIGPGMWLSVDDRFLVAAFGHESTSKKAEKFAHHNQCAFRFERGAQRGDGTGLFGRAYTKKNVDA